MGRIGRREFLRIASLTGSAAVVSNSAPELFNHPLDLRRAQAASPVRLTYAVFDPNREKSARQVIAEFRKGNPEVEVEVERTPFRDYWAKLLTSAAGGVLPDLMHVNRPYFPTFASKGVFLDLSPLIARDKLNLNAYPQALVRPYTVEGKTFALPKGYETIVVFYNRDAFEKAGVKSPNEGWTYQEYLEAAKKLTGKTTQYGTFSTPLFQTFSGPLMAANGGWILRPDNKGLTLATPVVLKSLQFGIDLIQVHKVAPQIPTGGVSSFTEDLFTAGIVAMIHNGPWIVSPYKSITKFRVGIAPLPKGSVGPGNTVHGLGIAISSKTKNPAEAWRFLKFLMSREGQTIDAAGTTEVPAHRDALPAWLAQSKEGYDVGWFVKQLPGAKPYPQTPHAGEWIIGQGALPRNLELAWIGQVSVKQAVDEAAKEINRIEGWK